MDKEAIIRRGDAAARLLDDETVMAALGEIERDVFSAWAQTNPSDTDGREKMFLLIRAIELLQNKLETFRQQGSFERAAIDQREQDKIH